MNGPAHWREADLILAGDRDPCEYGCPHSGCVHEMRMIALAQAHLTAALTAAVIAGADLKPADRHEWQMAIDPEYAAGQDAPLCRAHPDDCPNGPGPHAYYNPPELEGRCPCCIQPGDSAQPTGGTA